MVFFVTSSEKPCCPVCGSRMVNKDWVRRIRKKAGGNREEYRIERKKCTADACGKVHRILPDIWLPFKHYEAELIENVIDGAISEKDLTVEDYPCEATMARWAAWAEKVLRNAEGWLRSAGHRVLGLSDAFLKNPVSLLDELKKRNPHGWLPIAILVMCNAGGDMRPPDP